MPDTSLPQQQRAHATRQRILDVTLAMLAETSIDKISTNAIAQRSEVNIASLYKYFADKYAILGELALAFGRRQSATICAYLNAVDPARQCMTSATAWWTAASTTHWKIPRWSICSVR